MNRNIDLMVQAIESKKIKKAQELFNKSILQKIKEKLKIKKLDIRKNTFKDE